MDSIDHIHIKVRMDSDTERVTATALWPDADCGVGSTCQEALKHLLKVLNNVDNSVEYHLHVVPEED